MPERDKTGLPVDPEAPATEVERAEAEKLRAGLETEDTSDANADAVLARALSAAWSPSDLAPGEHRRIVERALDRSDRQRARRARVIRVSFGASAVVALAAGVALVVWGAGRGGAGPKPVAAAVAVSRSTQPLFSERFASVGGETARIDRIAMARASDLRDNEFARWGVR